MDSIIRQAIKMERHPVAILKTNTAPEGALQFKEGGSGCVIAMLAAASRGKTAVFSESTTGCPGGKAGLGFGKLDPGPLSHFLSTGGGPKPGEFYKKSPELAMDYIISMPDAIPADYVIFKPLDQVTEEETPVSVVFLVNADQLAGLVTLANYDQSAQDHVAVRFGAGCAQSILFSITDSEAGKSQCTIGITDPSARLHLDKDLLSFSIPYPRFLEMEANAESSFLTKQTWTELRKRI